MSTRRESLHVTRGLALAIVIAILMSTATSTAMAGEYPVYACEPNHGDVNRAWIGWTNHGGMTAYANCPPSSAHWGQGLVVRPAVNGTNPNATIPTGSEAHVAFYAPPGTSLARITYNANLCSTSGFQSGLQDSFGRFPVWSWADANSCAMVGPPQGTAALGGAQWVRIVSWCRFGPCAIGSRLRAWATLRSATVWVADYSRPGLSITGGSALGGWRRGTVDVAVNAWDNVGIRFAQARVGGSPARSQENGCDYTVPVPCSNLSSRLRFDTQSVPDGRHVLTARAEDSAHNWSTITRTIYVDNHAPVSPLSLTVAGGTAWRRTNSFSLRWRNPSQTGAAPIAGVETAVCPARNGPEIWAGCVRGRMNKLNATSLSNLRVPRTGNWLARVWLRDAAGNQDARIAAAVPLRFDDSPPQLSFGPQDAANPGLIDVRAFDAVSGIARTEVEIRRRGKAAWVPLATTRSRTGFSAYLDDERLADGVYEVRARAYDTAGNERSIDRDMAGRPLTRSVPVRIETRLVAGQIKRRSARRSRGGKRRTRRVVVVRPKVKFGRTIPIRGRLTMPGANPVANASIEVWERVARPGAEWRRVAVIGTSKGGRFRFKALRGPSRRLRFRYPGTPLVRARSTEVDIHVQAGSTIRSSRRRVVNGDEVVFRGRVLGRPLPATGKLVKLQAYSRGKWLTFATPRADARTGRWRYRYRFTATRGTVRYRFRAEIPREAGYPYDAGSSKRVDVIVRGL